MAIPEVSTAQLLEALSTFDNELRDSGQFTNWEASKAYKYAIEHQRKRYPVKTIVSIATGAPVTQFNGAQRQTGLCVPMG